MRQVLDLVVALMTTQSDAERQSAIKARVLGRLFEIIAHQASQPLVKPALKAFEGFVSKRTFLPAEILRAYGQWNHGDEIDYSSGDDLEDVKVNLDKFISGVFDWLCLPDISPAAGKFIVAFLVALQKAPLIEMELTPSGHASLWQEWIRQCLNKDPENLENIQRYIFVPLFKLDKGGSIAFLRGLLDKQSFSDQDSPMRASQFLILLAALDVGKSSGLVAEPCMYCSP